MGDPRLLPDDDLRELVGLHEGTEILPRCKAVNDDERQWRRTRDRLREICTRHKRTSDMCINDETTGMRAEPLPSDASACCIWKGRGANAKPPIQHDQHADAEFYLANAERETQWLQHELVHNRTRFWPRKDP